MDNASEALLIIVSSVLTVLMVVLIIATIKIIHILKRLDRITEKAEHVVDSAEAVGEFFKKSAAPVALGKLVSQILKKTKHSD